jgi:glutamate/aspartate transport system substrate-binding protein
MTPVAKKLVAALALLSAFVPYACHAQAPDDTLRKIKAGAPLKVGYRAASIPFSMREGSAPPTGYTLDLCARIIDNLRKELAVPDMAVTYVEVKSSDRIQKLVDGEVDIECGSTTNTRERAAQVTFANTIFITSSRILTRTDGPVKDIDSLKGQRVAIAQGASVAPLLTRIDKERALGIQYVRVKDFKEGFDALETGRATAFVSDDIQFAEFLSKPGRPANYAVVGEPISVDPLSIMMRKQDTRLHEITNQTLASLAASGEFEKTYNKWFMSPKLKFPMGEPLKKLLKSPNNLPNY